MKGDFNLNKTFPNFSSFLSLSDFDGILFQVKIWFQNRRNKWKRQLAADNEASNLRAFSGVPLFLQSNMANLHAAAAAAAVSKPKPTLPTTTTSVDSTPTTPFLATPTPTHPLYFPSASSSLATNPLTSVTSAFV